jgi:galactose mutarotase-like enzyme
LAIPENEGVELSASVDRQSLVRLANEDLSVDVLASRGARITSVKSRRDGREWLSAAHEDERLAPSYGARFTDTDHFGWDEMFPTVDACVYPVEPYVGQTVPDHGELWSATWEVVDETSTSISQRVHSDHFGYTFERSLVLEGATLRTQYSCVVDESTPATLPMLWALHPQFAVRHGSRVLLSKEPAYLLDTTDATFVQRVEWNGDLVVERDVKPGDDRMLYAAPEAVHEARIVDPNGASLSLTWDRAFAPYLGIWMDNGRFASERVVALEPTNGFFDELARAQRSGTVGLFTPGRRVSWWVRVGIEPGER